MRFPVILHTDDGIRYGVSVPDLPGCFSAGDGIDDALASAAEAIDLHLEGLAEQGDEWPLPLPIAVHQRDNPDVAGGIWALVEVETARPHSLTTSPVFAERAAASASSSAAMPSA